MINIKSDCFAYSRSRSASNRLIEMCKALVCNDCSDCRFYKTKIQFRKDLDKCDERLLRIGSDYYSAK